LSLNSSNLSSAETSFNFLKISWSEVNSWILAFKLLISSVCWLSTLELLLENSFNDFFADKTPITPSFGFCKRLSDFDLVGWLCDLFLFSKVTELLLLWPALVTGYWPRLFLLFAVEIFWAFVCLLSLADWFGFLLSSFNKDYGIKLYAEREAFGFWDSIVGILEL